jgi:hypothetical protein
MLSKIMMNAHTRVAACERRYLFFFLHSKSKKSHKRQRMTLEERKKKGKKTLPDCTQICE